AADTYGCWYLRLQRKPAPVLYEEHEQFTIGRAKVLRTGSRVTLVALGALMVREALAAADMLALEGIPATVIDALWLSPLDEQTLLSHMQCGCVVTCENHRIVGGLGSAVAELIAEKAPGTRLARIGVAADRFGEVGTQDWLAEHFGLTAPHIAAAARALVNGSEQAQTEPAGTGTDSRYH
ncbi:MAG: transketolase C-terminal domain-containing protein, partial [Rectinemataceae bacterium]